MSTSKTTRRERSITVWLPVDPERERQSLLDKAHFAGLVTGHVILAQERLEPQGYRFNPDDYEALLEFVDKFEELYRAGVAAMRIEPTGEGNVLPANVVPLRR
jgi:hypothetical protein